MLSAAPLNDIADPQQQPQEPVWLMIISTLAPLGDDTDAASQAQVAQELEQSKDDLREALASAEAANRSKDRFLAMVSHELRTPLTPALVTISHVMDRLDDHESSSTAEREWLKRDLALVSRAIELEARLIDDLLDLTRLARGRLRLSKRPLDLHHVVDDVLRILSGQIEQAGLTLEVSLDATHPVVNGDEARLRQVFWNLLSNAIKFNQPAGHIRVSSHDLGEDRICIEVTDTGLGIDPNNLPALFLAFEQDQQRRQQGHSGGLGLGLTISKGLMDLQGGKLRAFSEGPGRGSTFSVELPTVSQESGADEPGLNGPRAPGRVLEILLIDDHPDTLRAMRRLLTRLGHRVTTAASVAGARSAIAARGGRPFDLLLSDIGLPDGSGLDVPPLIRRAFPNRRIPAMALSGYGMAADIEASESAGFQVHLVKPISLSQLQETINRMVRDSPAGAGLPK